MLVYRIVSLWLVLAAGGVTLMALGGPKVLGDESDESDDRTDDETDDRADPARSV